MGRSRPQPIKLEAAPPGAAVRLALRVRSGLRAAADALVPPEVLAYETATSFYATRVAGALVELGVFDAIGDGAKRSDELADELGLHADTLHRVLRLAATQGLLKLRRGRFGLTAVGSALRSDADPTIAPWMSYVNREQLQTSWAALADSIRTGEPAFPATHGQSVWAYFAEHPDEEQEFARAMRNMTALTLPWIVKGYPWPEEGVVADVAGGSGPVLAGVLKARPALKGILVEAPGVLAEAEGHLASAGVRDRVELAEGDMFERIDARADLYLLKDIVHDWDDERSVQIIHTVAAAMPPGSKLLLIETLLERDETDPIAAPLDVLMLAQCDGGRQRSASELQDLIAAAGLRPGAVHETGGPALVEGLA